MNHPLRRNSDQQLGIHISRADLGAALNDAIAAQLNRERNRLRESQRRGLPMPEQVEAPDLTKRLSAALSYLQAGLPIWIENK